MTELQFSDLTPAQVSVLEKILKAGFRFMTLERVERYLAVEMDGFVALLDPADGKIGIFGQIGCIMSGGLGMLVERHGAKVFVCHGEELVATPEMLDAYHRVKNELKELMGF